MKIFQILLIAIFMFILNIWLFYTSKWYRNFLQSIKWDKVVTDINDNYKIKDKEIEKTLENELNSKIIDNKTNLNKELKSKDNLIEKVKFVRDIVDTNIKESIFFKNFLNKIFEKFWKNTFIRVEEHWSLMDVTDEYPDKYFEYYSPKLTIYNFPTKTYKEVKEIFEIESNWENYTINEVDNFWDESFYINLWEDYKDNFIRIIFVKNKNVIWIKVSKDEYNSIKNIIK